MKQVIRALLPSGLIKFWRKKYHKPHALSFGDLRRLTPVSEVFGFDRGTPLRRFLIEQFLQEHAADIQGCVLEVGDDSYTTRYGGQRVLKSEVLHVTQGNPQATIVADLTCADFIPADFFDCIILTQTLQCIWDIDAAVRTVYRILKPGGVILSSLPGISQASRHDMDRWGDYWRFTTQSAQRLFAGIFPPGNLEITAYGNVLVASAALYGLAVEDLRPEELDYYDPDYQVLITVRAYKSKSPTT
jgi:SAM-dependent methyltransferase